MANKVQPARPRPSRGFSLIEALIALLVMAFGMLSLGGMQVALSHHADHAKQRTEAMRLAQERMEAMRAYTSVQAAAGHLAWVDLGTLAEPGETLASAHSNTVYQRSWTVGGAPSDAWRTVSVSVAWVDRAGDAQSLRLDSVIARSDPAAVGRLALPLAEGRVLKRPKDRHRHVPVEAEDLGDGRSLLRLAPERAYVFSDDSGEIVELCDAAVGAATYAAVKAAGGCASFTGRAVSGFVSGAIDHDPGGAMLPLRPSGINTNALSGWHSADGDSIACAYRLAEPPGGPSDVTLAPGSAHHYLCIVPTAGVGAGSLWSGTLRLGGIPTDAHYKVCRVEHPSSAAITENQRNHQPYLNVNEALFNQNYVVVNSDDDLCPTVHGMPTTLHQNCRSVLAPGAATCPPSAADTPAS